MSTDPQFFLLNSYLESFLKMYASEELCFSSLGNQGQVSPIKYLFGIWRNIR